MATFKVSGELYKMDSEVRLARSDFHDGKASREKTLARISQVVLATHHAKLALAKVESLAADVLGEILSPLKK